MLVTWSPSDLAKFLLVDPSTWGSINQQTDKFIEAQQKI
jgi:hypothetical protein